MLPKQKRVPPPKLSYRLKQFVLPTAFRSPSHCPLTFYAHATAATVAKPLSHRLRRSGQKTKVTVEREDRSNSNLRLWDDYRIFDAVRFATNMRNSPFLCLSDSLTPVLT
ncbi:hypothetical protein DdX_04621 [Ditylenchus destructor]|uniref:Uncharacterized protein n=1 Tax=Ditylenchus destructor TaxID=166010 RepID=A0AAD4NEX1_9BILA|nr:hypothetical protein DdX_04621 [Ditylenchus destructor]